MQRRLTTVVLTCSIVLFFGALAWIWVQWRFRTFFDSMPTQSAETAIYGATAAIVIDSSAMPEGSQDSGNKALLDEYRDNPELLKRKAKLVTTWVNAVSLIKDLSNQIPRGTVVSSDSLSGVSAHRADAWGHPFCLFFDGQTIAVMSGGELATLRCERLGTPARILVRGNYTKKLIRTRDDIYAVVQPLGNTRDRRD